MISQRKFLLQHLVMSYRRDTVNDFHLGVKPVLNLSKPHSFSTYFGEEKEINVISSIRPLRR